MALIERGGKYLALPTHSNHRNGVSPGDDIRVGHLDGETVSIWAIARSGSTRKLAVPRHVFGLNFEEDRAHTVQPNAAYFMSKRAETPYQLLDPDSAGGAA